MEMNTNEINEMKLKKKIVRNLIIYTCKFMRN